MSPPHEPPANKCMHELCRCVVDPGERYCGEYCARVHPETADGRVQGNPQAGGRCHCGHPPCRP